MTAAPLSLVEPDMEISPIRLSPESSLPERIHKRTSPNRSKCAYRLTPLRARQPR